MLERKSGKARRMLNSVIPLFFPRPKQNTGLEQGNGSIGVISINTEYNQRTDPYQAESSIEWSKLDLELLVISFSNSKSLMKSMIKIKNGNARIPPAA